MDRQALIASSIDASVKHNKVSLETGIKVAERLKNVEESGYVKVWYKEIAGTIVYVFTPAFVGRDFLETTMLIDPSNNPRHYMCLIQGRIWGADVGLLGGAVNDRLQRVIDDSIQDFALVQEALNASTAQSILLNSDEDDLVDDLAEKRMRVECKTLMKTLNRLTRKKFGFWKMIKWLWNRRA